MARPFHMRQLPDHLTDLRTQRQCRPHQIISAPGDVFERTQTVCIRRKGNRFVMARSKRCKHIARGDPRPAIDQKRGEGWPFTEALDLLAARAHHQRHTLQAGGHICAKGEGKDFVSGGRIAPGGELPVNTNGGGLSCVHPGMYGLFVMAEAIRQARGECGDRQVKDAALCLAHGNGGVLSSQVTSIWGRPETV